MNEFLEDLDRIKMTVGGGAGAKIAWHNARAQVVLYEEVNKLLQAIKDLTNNLTPATIKATEAINESSEKVSTNLINASLQASEAIYAASRDNVYSTRSAVQSFGEISGLINKNLRDVIGKATEAINKASVESTQLGKRILWLNITVAVVVGLAMLISGAELGLKLYDRFIAPQAAITQDVTPPQPDDVKPQQSERSPAHSIGPPSSRAPGDS